MHHFTIATTLAVAVLAGSACADDRPPLASPLTFDEAIAIALKAQPGDIAEVALDRAEGRVVIDIEVINAAGEEVEFQLDARTGEIISTWIDDNPEDDPGE